jgi:hypothetical protein
MEIFVDGWVEYGRCGMEIFVSVIRRDDNGIWISLEFIWNAEGGRRISGGEETSFRVRVCGCLTLTNGECKEWSILGGGGDAGGVWIVIRGTWDSLKQQGLKRI